MAREVMTTGVLLFCNEIFVYRNFDVDKIIVDTLLMVAEYKKVLYQQLHHSIGIILNLWR